MENSNLPKHIGIIMDGNRRWAKERGLDIKMGHKEGAKTLENTVRHAKEIGIKNITVFAFSTENWKRSKEEVSALMLLLKTYLDTYSKKADTEGIRVRVLGDVSALSEGLRESIKKLEERTKDNTDINFNILINYGGRADILRATKNIAEKVKNNEISIDDIDEELFSNNLYTVGLPDPDVVVRTSGELRTSGFLTWQIVYSEFIFLEKKWPDFTNEDLDEVVRIYQGRKRNFGAEAK